MRFMQCWDLNSTRVKFPKRLISTPAQRRASAVLYGEVVFVVSMLPDFNEGSFWPGITGDGAQKPAIVTRVVHEGLREIVTCALEPLFSADVLAHRK